jgi:hypothetical protein
MLSLTNISSYKVYNIRFEIYKTTTAISEINNKDTVAPLSKCTITLMRSNLSLIWSKTHKSQTHSGEVPNPIKGTYLCPVVNEKVFHNCYCSALINI